MRPEQVYLDHLSTIERIAAFVARRNHVKTDDAGEFVQEVRVRLLDADYAVIRKFEGRSSFSTFLTTVIIRLFHQWRVEQWGKWRPSAEARRLGDHAIALERLVTRDGFSVDEAIQVLTTPEESSCSPAELEAIYLRLPLKAPRPQMMSDELLPEAVAVEPDADDRIHAGERERSARRATTAMDRLLESMEPEDRLILQMRFWDGLKVSDIARRLHLEQKKLYKRLDRIFVDLRRGLEAAGVSKSDIALLIGRSDHEIRFGILPEGGIHPPRPSHEGGGNEVRGGNGRTR
jgi:RNA polymerase sigma factor (sigma-70 family)